MLIIWAAILVYDYCLTFIAEVERFWVVRRLSWSLGFFYLNRYLTLLGYIPIILQSFWSTSNPNKTEVSILLLKSPCPEGRWKGTDANLLRCWYSSTSDIRKHRWNLMTSFVQLWPLEFVSRIPNHYHSGGRCLLAYFFSEILWDNADFFLLNIGMLIMRMYALYKRSRKVLAMYIVIAVVAVAVGCVSLNLRWIHHDQYSLQSDIPLLMSWCIVGNSEPTTRHTSGHPNAPRLQSTFGSRRVSTSDVGFKLNSLITPSLRAIRESN